MSEQKVEKFELKTKEAAEAMDNFISGSENTDLAKEAYQFFKDHANYTPKTKYQVKLNGTDYLRFLKKHGVARETLDKVNEVNTTFSNIASIAASDLLLHDAREAKASGKPLDPSASRTVAINTIYGTKMATCYAQKKHPVMSRNKDGKPQYTGQTDVYGTIGIKTSTPVKAKGVADTIAKMRAAIEKSISGK